MRNKRIRSLDTKKLQVKKDTRTGGTTKYYLVAIPLLVFWFILHIYPNIEIFGISFYRWNGLSNNMTWLGLQNFKVIFKSDQWFKKYFFNTSSYVVYTVVIQTILAMMLALVLRKSNPRNNFFRALFFLPIVLSSVAIGLTWSYIYDPNVGLLHSFFEALGLDKLAGFQYISGRYQALFFIALVGIWSGIGIPITLFTAGFQSIPEEIYEASALDGANGWQTFWGITLPQMVPTILRVMMLTISGAAMAFDLVLLLGGSQLLNVREFDTWSVAIYKAMVADTNYGMVAANSTVLAVFLFIICLVQYIMTKKAEDSYL